MNTAVRTSARASARRRTIRLAVAGVAIAALAGTTSLAQAQPTAAPTAGTTTVQVLGLNDFHGNLEPVASTSSSGRIEGIPAGGAEFLGTHLNRLEEAHDGPSIVVSAGDLIGASPLLSALFHDEPTIEAMNRIGLDINGVGNHEFDEGAAELRRMAEGGCHPVDGCIDGTGFGGAEFEFLAANVVSEETGAPLFAPFTVKSFGEVDVAFIGMTLQDTPTIVDSAGIRGWQFLDEAETANALVPVLKDMGVESIVVLLHEGGFPTGGYNSCPGISGPIVDIVNNLDDEIDAVVSGHTHAAYNCVVDGRPVTSAASFGRIVTDLDLTIDNTTNEVVGISAVNRIVTRDVPTARAVTKLITRYGQIAAPLANRVIGSISGDITRAATAAGESALGDVIADSQLAATDGPDEGGAVAAFMNPGGIRADLTYPSSTAGEGDGMVTYGEVFTVQPFGNTLTTLTVTGAQIDTMLEQQWCGQSSPKILQVSSGFTYTWSASAPACNRVDASTIAVNGVTVDPNASYRITVNSFLAGGGDLFTVLTQGTDRQGGLVDVDAFERYIASNSPVAPGPRNRITVVA